MPNNYLKTTTKTGGSLIRKMKKRKITVSLCVDSQLGESQALFGFSYERNAQNKQSLVTYRLRTRNILLLGTLLSCNWVWLHNYSFIMQFSR